MVTLTKYTFQNTYTGIILRITLITFSYSQVTYNKQSVLFPVQNILHQTSFQKMNQRNQSWNSVWELINSNKNLFPVSATLSRIGTIHITRNDSNSMQICFLQPYWIQGEFYGSETSCIICSTMCIIQQIIYLKPWLVITGTL